MQNQKSSIKRRLPLPIALSIAALFNTQMASASSLSTLPSSTQVTALAACTAINELQLRDGIAKQKAGACANNEVLISANIALTSCDRGQGIYIDQPNLVLRGANGIRYVLSMASTCLPEYGGVIGVIDGTNVKIMDLGIRRPATKHRRSIYAERANNLNLQKVDIWADAPIAQTPSVGLLVANTTGLWVEGVIVDGGTGAGMILRSTSNFKVFNSQVKNMISGGVGADAAIQIDQIGGGLSQHGNLSGNRIDRVPGQGIFIAEGSYIAVKNNFLNDIATREGGAPDGGRAIYLNRGQFFWVTGNQINRVDGVLAQHTRNGGGINASNCDVSKMVLENNVIRYVGNSKAISLAAGAEAIGPASGGYWNGYGISVRNEALVQGNTIENSSTYGILIAPAAQKVSVRYNPAIVKSEINNIKAVTGTAIDSCKNSKGVTVGASSDIEIKDNFIADAKLSGVNFETLSGPNGYKVSFLTNSMHRNDRGVKGIYLQASGTGPWQYYAPIPGPAWVGQTQYLVRASTTTPGTVIANDFNDLLAEIARDSYMTWNP